MTLLRLPSKPALAPTRDPAAPQRPATPRRRSLRSTLAGWIAVCACVGAIGAAPPVRADAPFVPRIVDAGTPQNPWLVRLGDVDGDGDLDVLTASLSDDEINWYENDGAQPPSYTPRNITNVAIGASSVETADVDGDGDLDVISGWLSSNTVAWHRNEGGSPPTFTTFVISTIETGTRHAIPADLDGDGDVDIVSCGETGDIVAWFENDGAATPGFTRAVVTTASNGPTSLGAADFDGDGDLDLAVASEVDNVLAWLENDGNSPPGFVRRIITNTASAALWLNPDDIDGDGDMDIALASINQDRVSWWENDGAAVPTFLVHDVTFAADGARSVHTADFDADGDVDLVSASEYDDTIAWYENLGSGLSFVMHELSTGINGASSVITGDLDGDGDVDVAAVGFLSNGVDGWLNDRIHRTPRWQTEPIVGTPTGADAVDLGDLDRDGRPDVVLASTVAARFAWYESRAPVIAAFGDSLTFGFPNIDPSWLELLSLGSQKINLGLNGERTADGLVRLTGWLAANPGLADIVVIMEGTNDTDECCGNPAWNEAQTLANLQAMGAAVEAAGATPLYMSPPPVPADPTATARLASLGAALGSWADANGKAFLDLHGLIAALPDPSPLYYVDQIHFDGEGNAFVASKLEAKLLALGLDESYVEHLLSPLAAGARDVRVADVDRDGDLDLVGASSGDDTVQWWESDGAATPGFTRHAIDAGALGASAAVPADVDGDGDVDVVATAANAGSVAWYESDGALPPVFTLRAVDAASTGAADVAAGDLDRDGHLDLVVVSSGDDTVAWYESDGAQPPGFSRTNLDTAATGASAVVVADVDADGDLDVVTSWSSGQTLAWYENDGAASPLFTRRIVSGSVPGAAGVAVRDVDLDGHADLVLASAGDDSVAWYRNDGASPPAFERRLVSDTLTGASAVAAGDVLGNGRVDIVATGTGVTSARLFENVGAASEVLASDSSDGGIEEGTSEAVLELDVAHLGLATDADIEVAEFDFRFTDDVGQALDSAALSVLLSSIGIHADDGSGSFEAGIDPVVTLLAPPFTLVDGRFAVPIADGDPNAQITATAAQRFFLVLGGATGGSAQSPNTFRVAFEGGEQVDIEHRDSDVPVDVVRGGPVETAPIGVIFVPTPPTLTISSPLDGSTTYATDVDVVYASIGELGGAAGVRRIVDAGPPTDLVALSGTTQIAGLGYGPHSVTLTLIDGLGDPLGNPEASASIAFDIAMPSAPPVADDQVLSTDEDVALPITLTATDPTLDPLVFSISVPPSSGSVTGTPPDVTYVPDADFSGADSFVFMADDQMGGTDTATISITVSPIEDAPIGVADAYTTSMNQPIDTLLGALPSVLDNDIDGDLDPLTADLLVDVTNGTLSLAADGSFVYTPAPDFYGVDTFVYRPLDGKHPVTTSATVTIKVEVDNGGLLGAWRFDEGMGSVVADSSGLGHDASVTGAVWTTGISGSSLDYDGVDDAATTGLPLMNGLDEFTMAAWTYSVGTASLMGFFGQNDLVEFGFFSPGVLSLYTENGGGFTLPWPFAYDEWHHVALVGDAAGVKLYLDGGLALDIAAPAVGGYGSSSSPFNIGGGPDGIWGPGDNSFGGRLDEVYLYDRALSATEIVALPEPGHGALWAAGGALLAVLQRARSRRARPRA